MYSHITPRVPRRPASSRAGNRAAFEDMVAQYQSPPKSLALAFMNAEENVDAERSKPLSPLRRAPAMEIARGILGALAIEYGGLQRCPQEAIDVACQVSGISDQEQLTSLEVEIEAAHAKQEQQERAHEIEIKRKSFSSPERKRALLESRLRYHLKLPEQPPQPAIKSQRSFVREYILGSGGSRARSPHVLSEATSFHAVESRVAAPPTGSLKSPISSRSGSVILHDSGASLRKQRPATAASLARLRGEDAEARMEMLTLRRLLLDVNHKVPVIQTIKRQIKVVDPTSPAAEAQLLNEIYSLMDALGEGNVTREAFVMFGKRLGGECTARFTSRTFQVMKRFASSSTGQRGQLGHHGVSRELFLGVMRLTGLEGSLPQGGSHHASSRAMGVSPPSAAVKKGVSPEVKDEKPAARWDETWSRDDLGLLRSMFRGCDADNDGYVSARDIFEFSKAHQKEKFSDSEMAQQLAMYETQLAPFDTECTGRLNLEQFAAMQRPAFDHQKKKREEEEPILFFKNVKGSW